MPDQKYKSHVTYDRNEIRLNVEPMCYKEARRRRGPVYDVVLHEMYEDNCFRAASYFKCLIVKENSLKESNSVRERVSDKRELLFFLADNARYAELAGKAGTCSSKLASFRLLYQAVLKVEEYGAMFDWLLEEFYNYTWNYALTNIAVEEISYNEMRVRFSYKFASYLERKGVLTKDIGGGHNTISLLEDILEVCKGQLWEPDTYPERDIHETVHESIATCLANIYLKGAKICATIDAFEAINMSRKAVETLVPVVMERNKSVLLEAYLDNIGYILNAKRYEMALNQMNILQNLLMQEDSLVYIRLRCRLFHQKAMLYYSLKDMTTAMTNFRLAYIISNRYKFRDLEGNILLQVGIIFVKYRKNRTRTRVAFEGARAIFIELNDSENRKKIDYLLGQMKAYTILPPMTRLMRSETYCNVHTLRLWKNQCKQFWIDPVLDPKRQVDIVEIVFKISDKSLNDLESSESEHWYDEDVCEQSEDCLDLKSRIESKSSAYSMQLIQYFRKGSKNIDCLLQEFIDADRARWQEKYALNL